MGRSILSFVADTVGPHGPGGHSLNKLKCGFLRCQERHKEDLGSLCLCTNLCEEARRRETGSLEKAEGEKASVMAMAAMRPAARRALFIESMGCESASDVIVII